MNQISEITVFKPERENMFYSSCIGYTAASSSEHFLGQEVRLRAETFVFILVNSLDVVMTFVLLSTGAFRESNPLANFVLENWGMTGMILFKFAFVAGIALIAQYVAWRQIGTARMLLNLGTLMVGGVVLYSGYLFVQFLQMN